MTPTALDHVLKLRDDSGGAGLCLRIGVKQVLNLPSPTGLSPSPLLPFLALACTSTSSMTNEFYPSMKETQAGSNRITAI